MIAALRRIHRKQMSRLRDLAVDVEELSARDSREALSRFARAFMGVERSVTFLGEADATHATGREIDYGRWLWQGSPPPPLKPQLGWLSDWHPGTSCIRFDRRLIFPALRLSVTGMLDEWAFSWPGAYVSFDSGRAMLVSLDREVSCYELAAGGKPPYR